MSLKFSIIVPTYNRAAFIAKAIESVMRQTYKRYELIIVDDGSTDNTEEVVKPFLSDVVHYYKIKNSERGFARNFGVEKSSGDVVTFFDSDDVLYPDYLSKANAFFSANGNVKYVQFAYEMKTSSGSLLNVSNKKFKDPNIALVYGNYMSCIGVFVMKSTFEEVKFSVDRSISGAEDWLLWLQLAARNKLFQSQTVTACMINHDDRSVLQFKEKQLVVQKDKVLNVLSLDSTFLSFYGQKSIRLIEARFLSYISLHAVLAKDKKTSIRYLILALKLNLGELFYRRFFAILKKNIS